LKFNFLDFASYKTFQFPLSIRLKLIILLTILILLHIPFLSWPVIIFLVHLAFISTLYNVPEKSKGWIYLPLRSIPVLKVFLIAYIWASISSFLPAIIESKQLFSQQHLVIFIAHFFFIVSITLPFDIRDYNTDNKDALITFPKLIGIIPTKIVALVCLGIFMTLITACTQNWHLYIFSLLVAGLILFSTIKRKDYYFTFIIDGTLIVYFFALILP